ncbi:unnamed protein product [Acanthoscelides obtectus]|uniref:RZZ complex subunit KNTC1/ROD C-terminal domain-containing protein n=1 Tax=Acanthoscelides obtectus TaxID=200917 RepID=A0A9P0L1P0_ACAOB|nr:unnamed protein product [Acanthoscelides obtectus]CAK1659805.1 Kinetochore-associated protein 1 [Acanthoscelides obtectus]
MGDFEIETGFVSADETINFGTRCMGMDSLYETATVACIKTTGANQVSDVNLNCIINNNRVIFCANTSLKLFKDTTLNNIAFAATFSFPIVGISIWGDAFLIVCLSNANFKVFNIQDFNDVKLVTAGSIVDGSSGDGVDKECLKVFTELRFDEIISFLVILRNGKIFRIKLETGDRSNTSVDEMFDLDFETNTASYSYPFVLLDGSKSAIVNTETNTVLADGPYHIKSVCPLENKFLCLGDDGHLYKVCCLTALAFELEYDALLEDLLVLEENGKESIFVVTRKNEKGEMFIKLLQPNFSQVFSVQLFHPVYLVPCIVSDEMYLISKAHNDTGLELRFQYIYEVEPELRLKKLVRRQRFQEAEQFAKTFNISNEIVLKAKVEQIIEKTDCDTDDIEHLLVLLDGIQDDLFKLCVCNKVDCRQLADLRKLYKYGSSISLEKKDEDAELQRQLLSELLFKFDTFMALSCKHTINSWNEFATCNLINKVKYFLKQHIVEDAIIVYSRLNQDTIGKDMTEENIEDIVTIINNLPTTKCTQFLSTFIPVTMSHRPSALPIFVDWLRNKIVHFEERDAEHFPENGIDFANIIFKLLRVDEKNSILFQWQCTLYQKPINDLRKLIDGLKILQNLKNSYGIKVSLVTYLQGPKDLITTLLGIVMKPEKYDIFFEEFLYSYIIQNQFDPNKIIYEKIKQLLEYGNTWMAMIETIIKYIDSMTVKLQAVKDILITAPVPWMDVTKRIALSAVVHCNHYMAEEIISMLEEEPGFIVLKKPVYEINVNNHKDVGRADQIVNRMIYVNEPTLIEDVFKVYNTGKLRDRASFCLLKHYIGIGDMEKMEYIFTQHCTKAVCKKMLIHCETVFFAKYHKQDFKDNFYSSLKFIFDKLMMMSDTDYEKTSHKEHYNVISGVYNANKMFQKEFKIFDWLRVKRRKAIYDDIIENIEEYYCTDSSTFDDLLQFSKKLAMYFLLDEDKVLIDICDRIGKLEYVIKVSTHLNENESDPEYLCSAALLILKYLGHTNMLEETFNMSMNLGTVNAVEETENEAIAVRLSRELVAKALVKAERPTFRKIMEVFKWIDCYFFLTKYNDIPDTEIFGKIYHEQPSASSVVFREVKNYLEIYVSSKGSNHSTHMTYIKGYNLNMAAFTLEDILYQMTSLPLIVNNMCREGLQLTAFNLITTLKSCFTDPDADPQIEQSLKEAEDKCVFQLILAVLNAEEVDGDLLFRLLLLRRTDYLKLLEYLLRNYKRQFKKFQLICAVGLRAVTHLEEVNWKGKATLVKQGLHCKWWKKMRDQIQGKVPYDEFFRMKDDKRLERLIKLQVLNLDLVKEYCVDYHFPTEMYLKEYLKSSLLNWKLEYDIITGLDGQRTITAKNDDNDLLKKCMDVIDAAEDKKSCFVLLESTLGKISCYQYEVFICINTILENSIPSATIQSRLSLLSFLQNYTRCNSPSQREKEEWYSAFPENFALDPLSEFRLPFTKLLFTEDIWSIVRPEVNLKTYKRWFGAAEFLPDVLKKDDICIYAVKQVVSSGVLKTDIQDRWILYPKFKDLLADVNDCVQHIVNLERATSLVYHLMYHIPNADKVDAARMSYAYAKKYRQANPDVAEVENSFVKVKAKYFQYSAMHILYKYNLADDNYLELLQNPEALIEALYMDPRIIEHSEFVDFFTSGGPDINRAVEELAMFFKLDILALRFKLLQDWLKNSYMSIDTDSSFYVPNMIGQTSSIPINDSNVKRAIYLSKSGNLEFYQDYLIKVTIEEPETGVQESFDFKAKALKCLCAITDERTVTKLTKVSYTEILNMIDTLMLLSDLESLGIVLDLQSLRESNKRSF